MVRGLLYCIREVKALYKTYVAKTTVQISCAATGQLICAFVIIYLKKEDFLLSIFYGFTAQFVIDLTENPQGRFSYDSTN